MVTELQPTPLRKSFYEWKESDDVSEVSGFGEEIVIAEIYVLKYETRICIVLWLPDFKTRTYSPEKHLWAAWAMLVGIFNIYGMFYQN